MILFHPFFVSSTLLFPFYNVCYLLCELNLLSKESLGLVKVWQDVPELFSVLLLLVSWLRDNRPFHASFDVGGDLLRKNGGVQCTDHCRSDFPRDESEIKSVLE